MDEKKKHPVIQGALFVISLALPFSFVFLGNVWIGVVLLFLCEIAVWLGFIYFIRLSKYNGREVMEQGESVDDILKLAYDKCMEARMATKSKSSFLAQMSHEIRTPINAVLGMNEMIMRESKEPATLDYASNAYNAGVALLTIINDILDISKIEAGKLEIKEAEYDLYSLVSDCYHMTSERALKRGLQYLVSVDETLPSKLCGDMFHLRQIIVNYLTNAIKYTDEGTVELDFSGERIGDRFTLKVRVKDTGIGLTEESMEKLFTSFQRFELERNQTVEGTGLGLAICKQLTELMDGRVEVDSVYGKGSTFGCIIPQRVVDDTPVGKVALDRPKEHQNWENGRKFTARDARILVVDDVQMNLLVFTSLLKGHELMIDEATSGKQCLEMVQAHHYDVIYMDHMMPEMDGMETFAHMQKMESKNKNTPVVMLTANAISGEKEKYLAAGFASYLTKPIQSNKLEDSLLSFIPEQKIVWVDAEGGQDTQPLDGSGSEASDCADGASDSGESALLDTEVGLFYSGGSREVYETILASYADGGQERSAKIGALCEKESWKDYVTEVHALKSTSLTIGAKELSEAAKELELAGKAGEYDVIRQKNDALLALYRNVLAAVARELGWDENGIVDAADADMSGSNRELSEIPSEELSDYRRQIREAADGFDSDAIIAVCDALSGCSYGGVSLAEKFKSVREAATDFECGQAVEQAEQIFDELMKV